MQIEENPFKLLGVTPENSIAEIDEAKDDKCFADEEREGAYEAARDMRRGSFLGRDGGSHTAHR